MQLPRHSPLKQDSETLSVQFYALILTILIVGLALIDAFLPVPVDAREIPFLPVRGLHRVAKAPPALPVPKGEVLVDAEGRPLSRNPVWNLCVRGGDIPVGVLRRNTDTHAHRRGWVRLAVPKSCDDYRRGSPNVWSHPDFSDVQIYLSEDGRLLGILTEGYVIRSYESSNSK